MANLIAPLVTMLGRVLWPFILAGNLTVAIKINTNSPLSGDVWYIDQDVSVNWKYESLTMDSGGDRKITQIDIDLVKGSPDNVVDNISFGVPVSITHSDWSVKPNMETGDDYMIRFTSIEEPKFRFVGPKFSILNNGTRKASKNRSAIPPEPALIIPLYIYLLMVALAILL